jgi:hypothetical protein
MSSKVTAMLAGVYLLTAQIRWKISGNAGDVTWELEVNGTSRSIETQVRDMPLPPQFSPEDWELATISTVLRLAPNDILELFVAFDAPRVGNEGTRHVPADHVVISPEWPPGTRPELYPSVPAWRQSFVSDVPEGFSVVMLQGLDPLPTAP